MKIQPEIRYALIVLALGATGLLALQWADRTSKRSMNMLTQIQGCEMQLIGIKTLVEGAAHDFKNVNDLPNRVNELIQTFGRLAETLPIDKGSRAMETISGEVDKVSSKYVELERQVANAPDSVKRGLYADYQAVISHSKKEIEGNIQNIQSQLSGYRHERDVEVQQSRMYHTLFMLFMGGFFLALAFITYKSFRSFASFKYQTETKSKKDAGRLETLGRFIEAIANGEYAAKVEFEAGDQLAERLVEMKNKLLVSGEMDRKRNWATQGMAEIGTLLRDSPSIDKLYASITRFCVRYTNSNQASLFVLNNEAQDERYLELVSTYAYDKQKYLKKRIQLGEGLLGQTVLEAQTVNMTKLPPNYIHITLSLIHI